MLFIHALNDRAIADVACTLAEETRASGHEVTLAAATVDPLAERRPGDVHVIDLGQRTGGTWRSVRPLRQAIIQYRPQVLFAHGNGPARAAVLATRTMRPRPTLITVEHNHYSSYSWTRPRLRHFVDSVLLPRADAVVGVSPDVVADLERTFPALRGRATSIAAPLSRWRALEQLAREPVTHPWFESSDEIVVSVANIHPRKDPETLVRAVIAANQRRVRPLRLLLLGRVLDRKLHDELNELVREAGLTDRVEFLGFVPNPLPYIQKATVFALTSRNEGSPLALLEAMALGTPVVSTDCPSGPRFLLEDGRSGRLVPVGDVEAVASALVSLTDDQAERQRLAASGPKRAAAFRPDRIAAEYLALAHSLM